MTTGNRFEDITVAGNVFWTNISAPPQAEFIRALSNGNFVFDSLLVQDNVIVSNGLQAPHADAGIQVRYTQDAITSGNTVRYVLNGLSIIGAQRSAFYDNLVEVTNTSYAYAYSAGSNSFQNNYYLGTSILALYTEKTPVASDVMQRPTPAHFDMSPARIAHMRVTNINDRTATLTWDTSELATTEVEYGLTATYGQSTYPRAPLALSHTVTLVGLVPQTLHHFRLKSIDSTGQQAVSPHYTFRTTPRQ